MDTVLDAVGSMELAKKINSKARKPFDNACKAAISTSGAIYVQGFLAIAAKPHKPMEHGWIQLGDRILDPNLPYLNAEPETLAYFGAQQWTAKQLRAVLEESKEDYPDDDPLPVYGSAPYEFYGDLMLGGREYQQAYEAADAHCQALKRRSAEQN